MQNDVVFQDLRALSNLGCALWPDSHRTEVAAIETMTVVSLLDLSLEGAVERASKTLLDRATREGLTASAGAIHRAFFRLPAEDRFLLAALHVGHWSYARLARILGMPEERVPQRAWKARLELAASQIHEGRRLAHPTGSSGAHCPEYDRDRPWTQRFLDEEMQPRERLFLQNHLMACDGCRQALARCRDLYYAVDALVPRAEDEDAWARGLQAVWLRSRKAATRAEIGFWESLRIFFARKQTRIVVAAAAILISLKSLGWI